MRQDDILSPDDLWDRIENVIASKNRAKKDVAEQCGFSRKVLSRNHQRYICTLYFARLCSVLRISSDYLLFGEENGGCRDVNA